MDSIHITEIVPGDVLRIAMKPGRHLEPVLSPRGSQHRLLPGRASANGRSLQAKSFSRTVYLGYVTQNDTINGVLALQIENRGQRREHLAATVPYKDIKIIQKFITPTKHMGAKIVPLSGAKNAIRRPGAIAKGVLDPKGFMNLVRVYF